MTSAHENLNSWIELKKYSGSSGWPTMVLVLPGEFSLLCLWAKLVTRDCCEDFVGVGVLTVLILSLMYSWDQATQKVCK